MPFSYMQGDIVDNLPTLFKAGNSKELAKNFSSSVELSILGEEDVYSKAQAEQILRDFFTKHGCVLVAFLSLIVKPFLDRNTVRTHDHERIVKVANNPRNFHF